MTEPLVARLRGRARWYRDTHPCTVKTPDLLEEAATELARLQAENEALCRERDEAPETFAAMMVRQSLATGHGDTFADLLREAEWQIAELRGGKKPATGLWPDWGDSPNGFDGPTGAE